MSVDEALCPHGFPPEFCGNCHEEDDGGEVVSDESVSGDSVCMMGWFYSHDGVVYVPTSRSGVVELRLVGDVAVFKRFRHSPSDFMRPMESRLVSTVRVPVGALLELLKP